MKYIVYVSISTDFDTFNEMYSGIEHDTKEAAESEKKEAEQENNVDYAYIKEV